MFPAAEEDDTFVEREEAWEGALEIRRDGVEFAGEVASRGADPGDGGVEAVVVSWGEVDYEVVELRGVCFGGGGGGGEGGPPCLGLGLWGLG